MADLQKPPYQPPHHTVIAQAEKRGQSDAMRSAINRLSWISVRYEKAGDTRAFHVAEECIADLVALRGLLEAEGSPNG